MLAGLYTLQVFDNVLIQPRDAREASDVFYRQRLGDVLLTYENEVVLTNQVCCSHWQLYLFIVSVSSQGQAMASPEGCV